MAVGSWLTPSTFVTSPIVHVWHNSIFVWPIRNASLLVDVSVLHVIEIIHGIGGDSHWSILPVGGLWLVVRIHQTSQLCGPISVGVDNLHCVVLSQGVAEIIILVVTTQGSLTVLTKRVVDAVISSVWVDVLGWLLAEVTGSPPAAPAVNTAVVIAPEHELLFHHHSSDVQITWWPDYCWG